MKAKNLTGKAPGGKRKNLVEILPLDTPLMIEFYPVYACNFKCNYCIFSVPKDKRHFISDVSIMDFDLYKKCIDDIKEFKNKLKVLRFTGIGEPLMHKKISDMIEYATKSEVAEITEIITNASLLTKKLSDQLIGSGLKRLVISLQGISEKAYKNISGVDINFENFVDNLSYFYNHKNETHVYIKIANVSLKTLEDEKKFFELFGDICDSIAIEHIVPIQVGVNYNGIISDNDLKLTQFGKNAIEVEICPQPFFTLRINTDGKVIPCYSYEFPCFVGDCNEDSVVSIWGGKKYNNFRLKMLNGRDNVNDICKRCKIIKHRIFEEDIITKEDAKKLRKYYES